MSSTAPEPEPEEPESDHKKIARSPAAQESNIPLGWKPTRAEPVPVVRCTQIKKDGNRCGRWSLRGYDKCYKHAGNGGLKNVEEYAKNVVEAARLRLIDESDAAIDTISQLMQPGTGEAIRLKAATEVLDRSGIRGGFEVKVEGEIIESPVDELKKRMEKLRAGAVAVQKMREERENADVVDGELVEEDDEQLSLFELEDNDDDA